MNKDMVQYDIELSPINQEEKIMNTAYAAQKIAKRIEAKSYGFDYVTIISILTAVLPQLLNCLQSNDDLTSDQVKERIVELHGKDPKRLQRRVAANIYNEAKREAKRLNNPMLKVTNDQAKELATAVIDEVVSSSSNEVTATSYIIERE